MDLLTAHGVLASLAPDDRGDLLNDPSDVPVADLWVAFATAFASLSGGLEDADTTKELFEAVRHGVALLDAEILTAQQVADECRRVILALVEWGDKHVPKGVGLAQIQPSNN